MAIKWRSLTVGAISFLLLMVIPLAYASVVSVSPIRLNLSAEQPFTVITLTNAESTPVVFQLQAKQWSYDQNNKEVYTPTKDIFVSPPIISIGAKSSQMVRIALRVRHASHNELAYRLFMQEVPSKKDRINGIQMVLRIGVPIFIAPLQAKPVPVLQWQVSAMQNGKLRVKMINTGNAHLQITKITATVTDETIPLLTQKTFIYLLPGQATIQELPLPRSANAFQLIAETDAGKFSENVSLASH